MEADPNTSDRIYSATQYADLAVQPGSKILPDLRFDPRQQHIYVMTNTKVSERDDGRGVGGSDIVRRSVGRSDAPSADEADV